MLAHTEPVPSQQVNLPQHARPRVETPEEASYRIFAMWFYSELVKRKKQDETDTRRQGEKL